MPLLHLAGISGNNKSFMVVFCFLAKVNLDYYTWALECFNSVISSHHLSPPEIIITDQELVIMNYIEKVLPNRIHMLCITKPRLYELEYLVCIKFLKYCSLDGKWNPVIFTGNGT